MRSWHAQLACSWHAHQLACAVGMCAVGMRSWHAHQLACAQALELAKQWMPSVAAAATAASIASLPSARAASADVAIRASAAITASVDRGFRRAMEGGGMAGFA